MKITFTISDKLYKSALEMAGRDMSASELVTEALKTFVQVENAKRLAALGGTSPDMPNDDSGD